MGVATGVARRSRAARARPARGGAGKNTRDFPSFAIFPKYAGVRWAGYLRGLLLLGGSLGGLNLGDSADGGVGGDGEHFLA